MLSLTIVWKIAVKLPLISTVTEGGVTLLMTATKRATVLATRTVKFLGTC